MRQTPAVTAGALALALVLGPIEVLAQTSSPGAPLEASRDAIVRHVAIDTFVALVPTREWGAFEAEMQRVDALEAEAARTSDAAAANRRLMLTAYDLQLSEIAELDRQIAVAREMDQGARREALEDERNLRVKYNGLIDARVRAYAAEVAVADRRVRHVRAVRKQLEVEKDLERDRAEWRALHHEAAVVSKAEERRSEVSATMQDRLKKYFEAGRDAERERERLAVSERELAELRLEVIQLRRDVLRD